MYELYNYEELIGLVPELVDYVKGDKLNYSCPAAIRLLNQALLLKDFNVKVVIPEGHLCPTIPNRTAYIKFIEMMLQDVLKMSSDTSVVGIDIGTGTCCVYPLIGCSRNEAWTFLATDIDNDIIKFAQNNIILNPEISERITIVKNDNNLLIFPDNLKIQLKSKSPKFVVCNPPFYDDSQDLESRRAFKKHKPTSDRCEMVESELSTELGGEIGFIKKMIDESIELFKDASDNNNNNNIRMFSCMLGMKESLTELLDYLKNQVCIKSFAFELLQIKHTCRYLLFWSFTDDFPKDTSNNRLKITPKSKRSQQLIINKRDDFCFEDFLQDIKVKFGDSIEEMGPIYILTLKQNKWSRKHRRSPETAPLLKTPLRISISKIDLEDFYITFTLLNDEEDWEIFLGFINHLRKEYQ